MPEFLSKLGRRFKGRTKESQSPNQKELSYGQSGIESTLLGVAVLAGDRKFGPEALLRPVNENPSGFFHNTQNPVFHNATMIDQSTTTVVAGDSGAMRTLSSHADPNAAVDSSAREPVPSCHPKTRREIREKLEVLLHDKDRKWRMGWLFGAAGTGKSAVGQTFASGCHERGELGAAFFFSRPNGRNKYKTVIPTLAYQLAIHCPPYQAALITRIGRDHHLFNKKPLVQFKTLIVEPLLEVKSQITTTFLMLLDGVDECGAKVADAFEREKEQRELVKMIAECVRDHPDLPLFWLLCSRPEKHLQVAFADIASLCQGEELVIDAECRAEVEIVLREGFAEIMKEHHIITPSSGRWPSEEDFNIVECAVAGLHVFGAAILRDIEHSTSPVRQLKSLIPFLRRIAGVGRTGSIEVMDLFYSRILGDVPAEDLPTTLEIIGTLITMPEPELLSAQALCNFMRLDPNDFSSALRMVHSVINIPLPTEAQSQSLHLYHASFSDFLTNDSRSGNFFVDKQKVLANIIKSCFFWHGLHYYHFHCSPARPLAPQSEFNHDHGPLPQVNFTWISSGKIHWNISKSIWEYAGDFVFCLFRDLCSGCDKELLKFICESDLRYVSTHYYDDVKHFINWVYNQEHSRGFIRTDPENDGDRTLLTYMETLTGEPVSPAQFPINWGGTSTVPFREYLLIGQGSLSIIVWYSGTPIRGFITGLSLDHEPHEDTTKSHEWWLEAVEWPNQESGLLNRGPTRDGDSRIDDQ